MVPRIDRLGVKVHMMTFLEPAYVTKGGELLWRARCDCGTEKIVYPGQFVAGHQKSCGCHRRSRAKIGVKGFPRAV